MKNIFDLNIDELSSVISPSFRVNQLWRWLYVNYENDFHKMLNLPKEIRLNLANNYSANNIFIKNIFVSSSDMTKKYLFSTTDNELFESVLLKMKDRKLDEKGNIKSLEKYTICVSSQIGCKMGCKFCRTGEDGFKRNLSAGEIVEQIIAIKKDNNLSNERSLNIVYMGMGEPLDNFNNLMKAIRIISNENGLSISPRRQTISTSGVVPMINMLGSLNLGVQLAISLHAVDDATRNMLMPINKIYNLNNLIASIKSFPLSSRKRIMFEYLMIKDINDNLQSAKKLLSLLDGIKAKINVILFNPYEGSIYNRPSIDSANAFVKYLMDRGMLATIRESKGIDIYAACGQLRYKYKFSHETKEEL